MTKTVNLKADTRTVLGKKVKRSRAKGLMPAVLYGQDVEPKPLFVDQKVFRKVYEEAGTSTLIDLAVDDTKPVKVLLHEPEVHYLSGEPIHVDFYAVKMTEKIETEVPINYIGISPAVEELEGNFIANKSEIQIRCFPSDLISEVEVDISNLKTFEDQIKVGDIKVPSTIEVLDDAEEVIALVAAPISEEELEAELAPADASAEEKEAVESLGAEPEAAEGENAEEQSE